MDASHSSTPQSEAPDDVVVSQSLERLEAGPSSGEQPSEPSEPTTAHLKAKRGPKTAHADRPLGKSLLPITRVQKILKADKELPACAKEAVFLISVATEEFIKRLGQAGQQQAVREKRTTVQRQDIAIAVRRADEFVFLEEILPSGIPSVPSAAAPVKRKFKASVPATDAMNIKDAFERGRGKATVGSDIPGAHEGGNRPDDDHAISNPGFDFVPPLNPQTTQSEKEPDNNEKMDVS